ncbi:MAG: hypothetical protein D6750_01705 [Bacteroidetes bacterium]|nr:MAG: hypothetical protein D6750_01705 [Bacteroidota bacterium]
MRCVIALTLNLCLTLGYLSSAAIASCSELKILEARIEREKQSTITDSLRLLGGLPFGLLSWLDRRSDAKIQLLELQTKRQQLIDKLKAEQEEARQNVIAAGDRYLSDRDRLKLINTRLETLIATWKPGQGLDRYLSLKQRAEEAKISLVSSAKELLRVKEKFNALIACPIIADSKLPERYTEVVADAQRLVDEQDQQQAQKEAQEQPHNDQGTPIYPTIYAIDGDTVKIGQRRYRLACIDAPESDQPLGREAREFLRSKVSKPPITLQPIGRDRYGRPIVLVRSGNELINLAIVKAGLAYYFRAFECPLAQQFDRAEKEAKRSRRGVWGKTGLIPPWVWRRQ